MPIAYVRASVACPWSALAEDGGTGLESVVITTPREISRTEIWPGGGVSQIAQGENHMGTHKTDSHADSAPNLASLGAQARRSLVEGSQPCAKGMEMKQIQGDFELCTASHSGPLH